MALLFQPKRRRPSCALDTAVVVIDKMTVAAVDLAHPLLQVEVAKRLGKAHSFVSKYELGERRVDFVELQQLAAIYKKDILFFRD